MQIAQTDSLKKRKISSYITSCIRNTSCSRGWLRLVVQIIFGTLIVSSFILIVLMALGSSHNWTIPAPRCTIANCRVICNEAPFYGKYEDDIITAASEVDPNCKTIALQLNRPTFENFRIPEHWLSRIRSNVRELSIIGGNIKHIPSNVFIGPSSSNLKVLILENIQINVWDNDMFIGLSGLKQLFIKNCYITDVRQNALKVVGENLEFLDIEASNDFNPINLTGTSKLNALTKVDFSSNNFGNILNNLTFSQLKNCRILFLNSCKITALKPGTFDHLDRIKMLYLNDNKLVTIPLGLFDNLLPRRPSIALQENYWHCVCSFNGLRTVFNEGLLIVDPICYYPDTINGMTFSDFEDYCIRDNESVSLDSSEIENTYPCENKSDIIYMNGACLEHSTKHTKNSTGSTKVNVIYARDRKCYLNRINNNELKLMSFENENNMESAAWIKPMYSVQKHLYSMIEMTSSAPGPGLGLLWYQSLCSSEVFCINTIPNILKVYNVESDARYTFCPFVSSNGTILYQQCLSYNFVKATALQTFRYQGMILYICVSLGCLLCGALLVYALIQRNPTLLKGNKRVIFVKHKSIEALILPPQVPIRKKFLNEPKIIKNHVIEKQKIFLLSDKLDKLSPNNFIRSFSTRSSESNDASYISALQPTEAQLSEWRSRQIITQFDNKSASDIDASSFSSIHDQDSLPYYSIHTSSERIYEVPKQY